jgi:hypothetical protein
LVLMNASVRSSAKRIGGSSIHVLRRAR